MLIGSPMPPQGGFWLIYAIFVGALKIRPASALDGVRKKIGMDAITAIK